MKASEPVNLQGLSVLVTRPRRQAEGLCELIEAAHGRPVRFPVMQIEPPVDSNVCREVLQQAASADLLVFTSSNAVEYSFELLPETLPVDLQIAAVGKATAARLVDFGLDPTLIPADRFDSEGLLALRELQQLPGKNVIIVRGTGGRQLLGHTLARRGASVSYAEVYRRVLPKRNPQNLLAGWDSMVDVVIATSNEILDNLVQLLGDQGREKLSTTPLLVISERVAAHARELGCGKLTIAANASDQAILLALANLTN